MVCQFYLLGILTVFTALYVCRLRSICSQNKEDNISNMQATSHVSIIYVTTTRNRSNINNMPNTLRINHVYWGVFESFHGRWELISRELLKKGRWRSGVFVNSQTLYTCCTSTAILMFVTQKTTISWLDLK